MVVNGLLSARVPCSLHVDTFFFFFFSPPTVGRNERLPKEGITRAYREQKLIQISCQSGVSDVQERQTD